MWAALAAWTFTEWALAAGVLFFFGTLLRWHLSGKFDRIDMTDLVVDERGKLSLYNLTVIFFCGLAAWIGVTMVTVGVKYDPTVFILGVMGIVIAGKEVKRGIDAYAAAPPSPAPSTVTVEGDSTKTTVT